ncbi:MAG: tandem-95 repeat protein, partial [Candidatus Aenigmatarchaeota archaeon]
MNQKIFASGLVMLALLLILVSPVNAVLSCPVENWYNYTTIWKNETGQNVSGIRALVFECTSPYCATLGEKVQDKHSDTNKITVHYCSGSQAPKYGYATYWFSPGYVRQEMWWKPAINGSNESTETFTKYPYCRAKISNLVIPSNITVGQSANIKVRIKSPISDAPNTSITPAADLKHYVGHNLIDKYFSANVSVTLNIYDQSKQLVWTNTKTKLIREDKAKNFIFEWVPITAGVYSIQVIAESIDDKCAMSITQNLTKDNVTVPGVIVNNPPILDLPINITFLEDSSTSLNLDDYVVDEDPESALTWSVSGNNNTIINIDPVTHVANFSAQPNWNGQETVTFTVTDTGNLSASQNVTIIVLPVNDVPVASDDSYVTDEDVTLNIPAPGILANDSDIEGDPLTAILVSDVTNGVLVLNADGSFTYTPAANWNGTDSFTYVANDGQTNSSPAVVTITVNPVNDVPVASDDSYVTDEDVTLNIPAPGILANDSDIEGDPLTA